MSDVLREIDRQHLEACRKHVEVGARISVNGAKRLINIIDILSAALPSRDSIALIIATCQGNPETKDSWLPAADAILKEIGK